jgi:fructose-1,6-bisphosphatase II
MQEHLSRNLGLDLTRATEAAAIAAGRWMGLGKPEEADNDAANAMAQALNTLDIDGQIIIGEEGKLGIHSLLDTGQKIGNGQGSAMAVVVDPLDGASLLAKGHSDAISVVGAAPFGAMRSLYPAIYMDKIVVDQEVADNLVPECMDAPAGWVLALVARSKKKAIKDLVVFVLDRPRHHNLVEEIRSAGARIVLRSDGDVAGALMAISSHVNIDILMGIGGVAEGVIAACAVKSLGGAMLGRLAPQSVEEKVELTKAGLNTTKIYTCEELVSGNQVFFAATGVTDGKLLSGVRYHGEQVQTESMVLRAETNSRRIIMAIHKQ